MIWITASQQYQVRLLAMVYEDAFYGRQCVSPGPVDTTKGYLSISIVTKGNPATVNKVGI